MPTRSKRTTALAVAVAVALALAACADEGTAETTSSPGEVTDVGEADETTTTTTGDEPTTTTTAVPDLESWTSARPECQEGPGKTITHLEPVVTSPVEVPGLEVPEVTIGGEVIEAISIPATTIPGEVIDTGCIIEHDAPAGCLGKVEISAVEIPEIEIPEVTIPGVSFANRTMSSRFMGSRFMGSRFMGSREMGERCQRGPSSGEGVVAAVVRPAIVRPAVVRPAVIRPAVVRPALCSQDGCVDAVAIDAVAIDAVAVDAVAVDAAALEAYVLDGTSAEVVEEDERTTYSAPADVLFAFDSFELETDAVPTLEAIAEALAGSADDAAITVEGHTDSVGGDDYNQRLSEQRAEAVATWLVDHAGVDRGRITTRGYGSTIPVADNATDEGQALNRRVVISVETG